MQSIRWYRQRLGSMSAAEVAWRVGRAVRGATDTVIWPFRRAVGLGRPSVVLTPGVPATSPLVLGEHLSGGPFPTADYHPEWRERLLVKANRLLANRLDLFDLEDHWLGSDIDWNYEYKAQRATPMLRASRIDYRDHSLTGDCKFAWEPSRFYHAVVLARAYRVSGEERYAQAVVDRIDSWIRQCPPGIGMQWRSGLELGIRLINWTWALALLGDSKAATESFRNRVLICVDRHLREITGNYSRFSSANNHLVGEAAGVFIAASYFSGLRGASRWRRESHALLAREITLQTFPDGGTREQATGYHLFVMEFFVLAGLIARSGGDDFPASYWLRLERMFEFAAGLSESGTEPPMIGDADDGMVLDLGDRLERVAGLMAAGALLFGRPEFKTLAGTYRESAFWQFGRSGQARFRAIAEVPRDEIEPRSFPDSGYYLLQRGKRGAPDRIGVLFDCGELGFLSIAGHGHADALGILLRVGGVDVLVDPGTYDYFTYPSWREYFRSTRAHNTVVVDVQDQSEMLGPFLWGRKAASRCVRWAPTARGGTVVGEHEGYASLSDPVRVTRAVTLADDADELTVRDDFEARGCHSVAVFWHFSEHCTVGPARDNHVEASFPGGSVVVELDETLSVARHHGSEDPIMGWVSRGYHRKVPATTLVGRRSIQGRASLVTRIRIRTGPG